MFRNIETLSTEKPVETVKKFVDRLVWEGIQATINNETGIGGLKVPRAERLPEGLDRDGINMLDGTIPPDKYRHYAFLGAEARIKNNTNNRKEDGGLFLMVETLVNIALTSENEN